jgi:Asp-tRNA(Asn)/Glu-tRNA(Gln) amidotransferase B subunit
LPLVGPLIALSTFVGVALMEIVGEPDLRSPKEAGAFVSALQVIIDARGNLA